MPHSLDWFRRFVKEKSGLVIIDMPSFGDATRYKSGLPAWLVEQLTKYLHIRQVEQAKTTAAKRKGRFDLAAFILLWQSGIRLSELEDLCLVDVGLVAGVVLIWAAKGLNDRSVYLAQRVTVRVPCKLRNYVMRSRGSALFFTRRFARSEVNKSCFPD